MNKRLAFHAAHKDFAYRGRLVKPQPKATAVSLAMLLFFYLLVFFAAPPILPLAIQRLAGVAGGLLGMLAINFAMVEHGAAARWLTRPRLRGINLGNVLGMALFLLTLLWWCSPWAPIAASQG